MIKIKISQVNNSAPVNIGKIQYSIETDKDSTWLFKKADTNIIIRRHVNKNQLKDFASSYCSTHNAELYIKDETGNITDIIEF